MKYKYDLIDKSFDLEKIKKFYGFEDNNIKLIEKEYNVEINCNGTTLSFFSEPETKEKIFKCFDLLVNKICLEEEIDNQTIIQIINNINNDEPELDNSVKFVTTYQGKIIKPKNNSQLKYKKMLDENTIVFAMGAAGTGKTYLAVAYAISLFKIKKISKIIITRPIVEAGENLGFLPGELKEKVDPYLTPIYDALYEMIGKENTDKYIERGIIEIAPLAYMRGRTLTDAFVILDEAQNTTSTQMKMFLTRLGNNSKMVITGDESQIDLKSNIKSGIIIASDILKDINSIGIIKFDSKDVVRHPLVSKIIKAYNEFENNKQN